MNIIILGPQGSGKGTQAKLLADKFNLFYFESGGFLRKLAQKNKRIRDKINRGEFLADEEMFSLVSSYLKQKKKKIDDIILDGYPRSIKQYKLLNDWLKKEGSKIDFAIVFEIGQKESVKRLSARRIDKETGEIYNLITNPPGPGIDKRNLIQREDDKPEAIRKRLTQYKKVTLPLLKLLKKEGILIRVDGERPIKTIFRDVVNRLKKERCLK